MKIITGDIKDLHRSGQIGSKEYIRLKKNPPRIKETAEVPEENKELRLIHSAVNTVKKAIEDNNTLMQSNITIIQSAVNLISELKEILKKEPPQWDKIHVDVKRNKEGKIKSVEMKRKD